MKKICEFCKNEFDAERDTAKYCSERCKKSFQRSISGTKKGANGTNTIKEESPKKSTMQNNTEKTTSSTGGKLEISGTNRDDPYSPNYDLSEEGFIRRNKNWGDFSARFKENIRKDAAEYKIIIAAELEKSNLMREGFEYTKQV